MNSIRHLEMIQALASQGNFTKAAEVLGITQPALTRGIHYIEKSLGFALFMRSNPIRPTSLGELVLSRTRPILTDFNELLREIALAQQIELGTITISAAHYPAAISVQAAVASFSRAHPRIQCSLHLKDWTDVQEDVRSGLSDIGIAYIREAEDDPEFATERLRENQAVFFCRRGHPLAKRTPVATADLFEFPWAGPPLPDEMAQRMPKEPLAFASFDPTRRRLVPRIHVESFAAMRAIVLDSDCITAAPAVLIADDIAAERIHVFALEQELLSVRYGFILNRNRSVSPAAARLMEFIRGIESERGNTGVAEHDA